MFTGIIQKLARVEELKADSNGGRLKLLAPGLEDVALGESISINGVCLTVAEKSRDRIQFDLSPETLARSTLGQLKTCTPVNLERALAVGDRIGGHFVSGHVDG